MCVFMSSGRAVHPLWNDCPLNNEIRSWTFLTFWKYDCLLTQKYRSNWEKKKKKTPHKPELNFRIKLVTCFFILNPFKTDLLENCFVHVTCCALVSVFALTTYVADNMSIISLIISVEELLFKICKSYPFLLFSLIIIWYLPVKPFLLMTQSSTLWMLCLFLMPIKMHCL